jgi:hypothetical protein
VPVHPVLLPLAVAEATHAWTDGVYVIWACSASGRIPIDVGESENVGMRLRGHPRKREWEARIAGRPFALMVSVHPTPPFTPDRQRHRLDVEQSWRSQYRQQGYSLCGIRP